MKTYELLTIFKPNLDAEEVEKAVETLNKVVVDFGGKIESTDKTGRKKVAEFRRQLKLNDNVLRTMFLESSKVSA